MLPPHELKKRDFTRVLRGYNSAEVDEHIDFIIEKYTELYRRNDELEKELRQAKAKLDELSANEDAIRRAMVNAQRAEHKIVTEANERADLIMRTAKHNCDRVLVDFKNKVRDERMTLHKLQSAVAQFKENTLRQYQTHLEYIEQISPIIEGEEEWDMSEDEYTEKLLEQMKIDIAGSVQSSFTEENDPELEEVKEMPKKKEKEADVKLQKPKNDPQKDIAKDFEEGATISFDAIRSEQNKETEAELDDAPTREIGIPSK